MQDPIASHTAGSRSDLAVLLIGVPASEAAVRQRLMMRWVAWLLGQLVVPLLRANFYVTESENYRQQIFYYRSASVEALICTHN